MARICIIQGHPDAERDHFGHALCQAYAEGALEAGHQVEIIDVARLDFAVLRDPAEFATAPPEPILKAQAQVAAADHLVVFFPLWLGTMPALLKAFFEQLARANFAIGPSDRGGWPRHNLKGRSARVVVTMGMPALAYRTLFGAHGVRSLESGVLGLAGVRPIRRSLVGTVEASAAARGRWLARLRRLGAAAR